MQSANGARYWLFELLAVRREFRAPRLANSSDDVTRAASVARSGGKLFTVHEPSVQIQTLEVQPENAAYLFDGFGPFMHGVV